MHKQMNMGLNLIVSLFLPLVISLIPTAISQDSDLLYNYCRRTSQNYTENSTYSTDLNNLLDEIYAETPQHQGFWKAQKDEAYGIGLCRGDVSADECDYCLYDARCKVKQRCNKKNAIVWYDYCSLKYGDYNFFGEIDTKNRIRIYYLESAIDPKGFNATMRSLLGELSDKAVGSDTMFAFGNRFEEKENETIYAMVQCSRDLSPENCTICLGRAVDGLAGFTLTSSPIGGRTITGSCNVRYDIFPFLNYDEPEAVFLGAAKGSSSNYYTSRRTRISNTNVQEQIILYN